MPRPPFYSTKEAQAYLGVTPQKLRGMVATGEIEPPHTIGDEQRKFCWGMKQTTGWPKPVLDRYLAERDGKAGHQRLTTQGRQALAAR